MTAKLHFTVHTFALQLLLKSAQGLIDVVVANDNLHRGRSLSNPILFTEDVSLRRERPP